MARLYAAVYNAVAVVDDGEVETTPDGRGVRSGVYYALQVLHNDVASPTMIRPERR